MTSFVSVSEVVSQFHQRAAINHTGVFVQLVECILLYIKVSL